MPSSKAADKGTELESSKPPKKRVTWQAAANAATAGEHQRSAAGENLRAAAAGERKRIQSFAENLERFKKGEFGKTKTSKKGGSVSSKRGGGFFRAGSSEDTTKKPKYDNSWRISLIARLKLDHEERNATFKHDVADSILMGLKSALAGVINVGGYDSVEVALKAYEIRKADEIRKNEKTAADDDSVIMNREGAINLLKEDNLLTSFEELILASGAYQTLGAIEYERNGVEYNLSDFFFNPLDKITYRDAVTRYEGFLGYCAAMFFISGDKKGYEEYSNLLKYAVNDRLIKGETKLPGRMPRESFAHLDEFIAAQLNRRLSDSSSLVSVGTDSSDELDWRANAVERIVNNKFRVDKGYPSQDDAEEVLAEIFGNDEIGDLPYEDFANQMISEPTDAAREEAEVLLTSCVTEYETHKLTKGPLGETLPLLNKLLVVLTIADEKNENLFKQYSQERSELVDQLKALESSKSAVGPELPTRLYKMTSSAALPQTPLADYDDSESEDLYATTGHINDEYEDVDGNSSNNDGYAYIDKDSDSSSLATSTQPFRAYETDDDGYAIVNPADPDLYSTVAAASNANEAPQKTPKSPWKRVKDRVRNFIEVRFFGRFSEDQRPEQEIDDSNSQLSESDTPSTNGAESYIPWYRPSFAKLIAENSDESRMVIAQMLKILKVSKDDFEKDFKEYLTGGSDIELIRSKFRNSVPSVERQLPSVSDLQNKAKLLRKQSITQAAIEKYKQLFAESAALLLLEGDNDSDEDSHDDSAKYRLSVAGLRVVNQIEKAKAANLDKRQPNFDDEDDDSSLEPDSLRNAEKELNNLLEYLDDLDGKAPFYDFGNIQRVASQGVEEAPIYDLGNIDTPNSPIQNSLGQEERPYDLAGPNSRELQLPEVDYPENKDDSFSETPNSHIDLVTKTDEGRSGAQEETIYDLAAPTNKEEAAPANQDDASSIAQSPWQKQELKTLGEACLGKTKLPTQEDENNKRLAFELGSQLVKSYATGRDLPREVKSSMLKRGGKAYPLSEKTVEPFKLKEAEFNSFVTSLENTADVKEKMLHHLLSDNSEQKDYDSLKRAYLASIANTKFVSEVLVFESSSSVAPNSPELPEVDYNEDDSSPETTKVENVTDRESPLYDLAAENLEADPNSPKTPEVEDPLYDLAASIITTNPEEVGVGVVGVVVETYYDLGNNPTTNITITEAEAAPANQDDASSIAQSAWQEQELKTLGDACLGKIQLPTKEQENNKRLARELGQELFNSYSEYAGTNLSDEAKSSMLNSAGKTYPLSEKTVQLFKRKADFKAFVAGLQGAEDRKKAMLHHLLSDNAKKEDYNSLKQTYLASASIANTEFKHEVRASIPSALTDPSQSSAASTAVTQLVNTNETVSSTPNKVYNGWWEEELDLLNHAYTRPAKDSQKNRYLAQDLGLALFEACLGSIDEASKGILLKASKKPYPLSSVTVKKFEENLTPEVVLSSVKGGDLSEQKQMLSCLLSKDPNSQQEYRNLKSQYLSRIPDGAEFQNKAFPSTPSVAGSSVDSQGAPPPIIITDEDVTDEYVEAYIFPPLDPVRIVIASSLPADTIPSFEIPAGFNVHIPPSEIPAATIPNAGSIPAAPNFIPAGFNAQIPPFEIPAAPAPNSSLPPLFPTLAPPPFQASSIPPSATLPSSFAKDFIPRASIQNGSDKTLFSPPIVEKASFNLKECDRAYYLLYFINAENRGEKKSKLVNKKEREECAKLLGLPKNQEDNANKFLKRYLINLNGNFPEIFTKHIHDSSGKLEHYLSGDLKSYLSAVHEQVKLPEESKIKLLSATKAYRKGRVL